MSVRETVLSPVHRRCLGCREGLPALVLDLGRMPLANSYVDPAASDGDEERLPLSISYCQRCNLVQLDGPVSPNKLFSEYSYFSSYSELFVAHARHMAEELTARFNLDSNSRVLEIASNDGYLLQFFKQRGIQVLGIEPASNIARVAQLKGIPTLNRFFGSDTIEEIRQAFGRADLIVGNNVLAHVPSINEFLASVTLCLNDKGTAVFELPYVRDLLEQVQFDTIYHEHVFYYSLTAIAQLVSRAGLQVTDVSRQPIHGGSLRIYLNRTGVCPAQPEVLTILQEEHRLGLDTEHCYRSFGSHVDALKRRLLSMLQRMKAHGKRLAAYGAPAKGNTLLNYCGISSDLLEFTVDRNPHKQGLLLPGSHIPILPPAELIKRHPDYVLLLPWNIAEEIIEQQSEYLRTGGQFIVPIPEPRVVQLRVV